MKRSIAITIVAASIGMLGGVGASVTFGAPADSSCWDEYDLTGTRKLSTIAVGDGETDDCTPADTCMFRYRARDGKKVRWLVPFGEDPALACGPDGTSVTATTLPATTVPAPTTTATTTVPATTVPAPTTTAATTIPAPTTTVHTTTVPATTEPATTEPATTEPATTEPATTVPAPTTTVTPPTIVPAGLSSGDFIETFDGNTGLDRFRRGVFHRDVDAYGFSMEAPGERTWTGDHDLSCGTPGSQRVIDKANRDESFYMCRNHMMTSIGAADSYSLGWFSPDQTFSAADTDTVSWDVNVTNLLARQWWEVILVDPSEPDLLAHPNVAGVAPAGPGGPGLIPYPDGSVVVGNGPFAPGPVRINGEKQGWRPICTSEYAIDSEGCNSKAIRRTFTITDNRNGTITVTALGATWTVDGAFPDEFKVVFKDHNYTPDKDGPPVGHTWHWDNISVT